MQDFDIESLTNHDSFYWRIDWFGYLSYYDSIGERRSVPLVEVYLSRLRSSPWKSDLNDIATSDCWAPRKISVPVDYLTQLRLGDIWQKGKLVMVPKYDELNTGQIQIPENRSISYFTSSKKPDGKFLVSFDDHPYHHSAPRTYCEVITLPNGKQVIIPHWVILQAYFSRCSYVFRQAFQFGLKLDGLYNSTKSHLDSGHGVLQLRKKVHDEGAEDVARIAWDPVAQRAYQMVSNGLARASANHWTITPKTRFPYAGITTLKLRGKRLPCITGPDSFIVFDITSCSADFPFDTLEYYRENPGNTGSYPEKDNYKPESPNRPPRKVPRAKSRLKLKPEKEPKKGIEELALNGRQGTSLLGLNGKQIEKKHRDTKPSPEPKPGIKTEPVDTGNAGSGVNNGEGAPIKFVDNESKPKKEEFVFNYPICRLHIFRQVCNHIAISPAVKSVRFIPINETFGKSEGTYSFFPKTFTESGRERMWRYVGYVKGIDSIINTLRRILVAEIITDEGCLYIVEVERRVSLVEDGSGWVERDNTAMLLLYSKNSTLLPKSRLQKLLEQCAEQSGTWFHRGEATEFQGYVAKPLKHPENQTVSNPDTHIKRIIKYIETASEMKFEEVQS